MMTIKTTTWGENSVEMTRLFETNGSEIIINRWHYNTYNQFKELAYEKFNNQDHPYILIGDTPKNNDSSYGRELLWVSYYGANGDMFTFILTFGYMYVMQDGKTVEKYYIGNPNLNTEPNNKTNKQ